MEASIVSHCESKVASATKGFAKFHHKYQKQIIFSHASGDPNNPWLYFLCPITDPVNFSGAALLVRMNILSLASVTLTKDLKYLFLLPV